MVRKLEGTVKASMSQPKPDLEKFLESESRLFRSLCMLIQEKGSLSVSFDKGGGGVGLYWCATLGGQWPFCSGPTIRIALLDLVETYERLEREALQKRINEIDASSGL